MKKLIFSLTLLLSVCTLSLAQVQTTFILIRHAEKASDDPRDPSLTPEGIERSKALSELLKPMEVSAIYSTPLKRTRSTVAPLATDNGLEVQTYDYKNESFLNELLEKHRGGIVVISGHSNTTPTLVNRLLGEKRFEMLDEKEFDKIFLVTTTEIGESKVHVLSY